MWNKDEPVADADPPGYEDEDLDESIPLSSRVMWVPWCCRLQTVKLYFFACVEQIFFSDGY